MVQCVDCEHFRMWDGDPCCLEFKEGWKLVLPDRNIECVHFKERSNELVNWKIVWEEEKYNFFNNYSLTEKLYNEYIKEHPEYEGKITKK